MSYMDPSTIVEWRQRYNKEIYHLYCAPDIVTDIKIARMRWVGHVKRMNSNAMKENNGKYTNGNKESLQTQIQKVGRCPGCYQETK